MSRYADRIQGTDRLLRIRRIRKAVFAGIIALTLGVFFVTHATVVVTSGHALVTLTRNGVNVSMADLNATQRGTLDVEPRMWAASATWSLIFQNQVGNSTFLTFVLEKGVVPTLFSTVPFLLFLYGVTETSWWIVLRPVRD